MTSTEKTDKTENNVKKNKAGNVLLLNKLNWFVIKQVLNQLAIIVFFYRQIKHVPLKDDAKTTCKRFCKQHCKLILILMIVCSTIVCTGVGVGVFVTKNKAGSNNQEDQESQEGFPNRLCS